jgi:hypothetical protein
LILDSGKGRIGGATIPGMIPLKDIGGNSDVGLEGRVESPMGTLQDAVVGNSGSQNHLSIQDPSILSEIEDSMLNFVPSYRDVLNRDPLSIYYGGDPVPKIVAKLGKEESGRDKSAPNLRGEDVF